MHQKGLVSVHAVELCNNYELAEVPTREEYERQQAEAKAKVQLEKQQRKEERRAKREAEAKAKHETEVISTGEGRGEAAAIIESTGQQTEDVDDPMRGKTLKELREEAEAQILAMEEPESDKVYSDDHEQPPSSASDVDVDDGLNPLTTKLSDAEIKQMLGGDEDIWKQYVSAREQMQQMANMAKEKETEAVGFPSEGRERGRGGKVMKMEVEVDKDGNMIAPQASNNQGGVDRHNTEVGKDKDIDSEEGEDDNEDTTGSAPLKGSDVIVMKRNINFDI